MVKIGEQADLSGFGVDDSEKDDIIKSNEVRYNKDQPRDSNGRFGSGGGSGRKAKKGGKRKSKTLKLSAKENDRVSHGIATDFPKLKADGVKRTYEFGNYSYDFYIKDFGTYKFVGKKKLR